MNATWIIAQLTFRETVRRRVVLAALIIGFIFLVIYSLGFYLLINEMSRNAEKSAFAAIGRQEIINFLNLAGLYTVNFLCIAMSALLAADTLAGEITTGTIQTLVTKPIRRSDIVFGKWLGFALLLFLYLISIAGGIVLSIWIQTGFLAPHLLRGVGLIYLASLLTMSVTMMCSSRFSAMATGATVFGLYGLAFIGGWIEQFGSFARSQTAIQVGIVSSLIFPSESIWRRAAYEMQSPLAGMTGMTPFITISVPSFMMILYSAGYIGLMLLLTWHHFDQRDL